MCVLISLCEKLSFKTPVLSNFSYWIFFYSKSSFSLCFYHLNDSCASCSICPYHLYTTSFSGILGRKNSSGAISNALQKASSSSPDIFLLPVIIALNLLLSILISGSQRFIFCITHTCVLPCSARSLLTVSTTATTIHHPFHSSFSRFFNTIRYFLESQYFFREILILFIILLEFLDSMGYNLRIKGRCK